MLLLPFSDFTFDRVARQGFGQPGFGQQAGSQGGQGGQPFGQGGQQGGYNAKGQFPGESQGWAAELCLGILIALPCISFDLYSGWSILVILPCSNEKTSASMN